MSNHFVFWDVPTPLLFPHCWSLLVSSVLIFTYFMFAVFGLRNPLMFHFSQLLRVLLTRVPPYVSIIFRLFSAFLSQFLYVSAFAYLSSSVSQLWRNLAFHFVRFSLTYLLFIPTLCSLNFLALTFCLDVSFNSYLLLSSYPPAYHIFALFSLSIAIIPISWLLFILAPLYFISSSSHLAPISDFPFWSVRLRCVSL